MVFEVEVLLLLLLDQMEVVVVEDWVVQDAEGALWLDLIELGILVAIWAQFHLCEFAAEVLDVVLAV